MSAAVVHIRRRLPRRGGNWFYKAGPVGDQHIKTFCGAEVTDRDTTWQHRNTKWTRANACPACLEAVELEAELVDA